jgi:hypothetical protein
VAVKIQQFCIDALREMVAQVEMCGAGPVCTAAIFPGEEVAWDYCGECASDHCGFVYIKLTQGYPSTTFPAPALDLSCAAPLAFQVDLGIVRCLPVMDDDGDPPDPDELSASALSMMDDMFAIKHAIAQVADKVHILGNWVPQGPVGGCVGGYWTLFVSEL